MRKRKCLAAALAAALITGLLSIPAFAAAPQIKLELKVSGGTKAGETLTAELWCEDNPGLASVQFTLGFDQSVLDCTEIYRGPILSGMMAAENPNDSKGATIAAASATPTEGNGVLAEYTFKILKEGNCQFNLISTTFKLADGTPVYFTATNLSHVIGDGGSGSTDGSSGGSSSAETPGSSGGGAQGPESAFTDTAGHWAEEYFATAKERGLMAGYDDGRVGPEDNVSRAQFVQILWRSAGSPEPTKTGGFVDVKSTDYFYKAVSWAEENGYVSGVGDSKFAPHANVSREQIAVVLRQMAGGGTGAEQMFAGIYDKHFTDSASTAFWAKDAVYWAVYKEVWCGKGAVEAGDLLAGPESASRAEIAVMVIRFQDKMGG